MNTSATPLSKKRRLSWWRLLGCLILSLFLWWGVGKLLEPQPVWSIVSKDGNGVQPLYEQEDGPYLLAVEFHHKSSVYNREPLALLVVDKQSGQVLHRLETRDPNLLKFDQVNTMPRIHGDVIWRLAITENVNGFEYRLCGWKYKEEQTEKTVHPWQEQLIHQMRLQWPGYSKIILIHRQQKSLELRVWTSLVNSLLALTFGMEFNLPLSAVQPWFEAWQLPESPEHPSNMLSQWRVPAERIQSSWTVSDDGKHVVILEPQGDPLLAENRAKASGQVVFNGSDLFKLFRSDTKGMQLYDTATGRCIHDYLAADACHSAWGWHGQYLIAGVVKANSLSAELTLSDYQRGAFEWSCPPTIPLNPFQRLMYRVDEKGFHPVTLPKQLQDSGGHVSFHGNRMEGWIAAWDASTFFHLGTVDDQIRTVRQVHIPRVNRGYFRFLFSNSTGHQYLTKVFSPWRYRFEKWKGNWRVLNWFYDKIKDQPWVNQDACIVHDVQPDRQREQSFDLFAESLMHFPFSKLYLRRMHMTDINTITGSTLLAFELPMQIHSPWWARSVASVPWLWLIWRWGRGRRNPSTSM